MRKNIRVTVKRRDIFAFSLFQLIFNAVLYILQSPTSQPDLRLRLRNPLFSLLILLPYKALIDSGVLLLHAVNGQHAAHGVKLGLDSLLIGGGQGVAVLQPRQFEIYVKKEHLLLK